MTIPKRILTIDGGGLRGVFAASIIEQMELVTGKSARDLFDCFYGTSTGAILAAGLAIGMRATELKNFYLEKGATVFQKLPWYHIIKRALYWTYSKEELEQELKRVFGTRSLFDVGPLLSIQTKNTQTSNVDFFNNFPYTRRAHGEKNLPLWQIIRASTAAPTYFEPEMNRYIDGGISSYNNSSYASFIGATKYLDWPAGLDHLRIYSVGTGYHPPVIPSGELDEKNKIQMAAYMVEELMDDINLLQNQIMKRLENDQKLCWYKRYTIRFDKASFDRFGIPTDGVDFDAIAEMDAIDYLSSLANIGHSVAAKLVLASDFA